MRNKVKLFISLIISTGVLIFFIYHLSIAQFIDSLKKMSFSWILFSIFFFVLQTAVRALRFKYVLHIQSMRKMFGIQSATTVLKNLLPANMGELSILYLFKKIAKVGYAKGTTALFVMRTLDILLFSLLFIILYFSAYELFYANSVMKYIMSLMLILILILLLISFFSLVKIAFVTKILGLSFFRNNRVGLKIKQFVSGFRSHLKGFLSFKSIAYLTILTMIMWTTTYFVFVSRCKAIHANLSYYEILFIFLVLWPFNILPIKGVGDLGSYELGWGVSLSLLGYPLSSVSLITLGTHTITYINLIMVIILILILYNQEFVEWLTPSKTKK